MSPTRLLLSILLAMTSDGGTSHAAGPVGPADYPEIARLLHEPLPETVPTVGFETLWHDPAGHTGRAVRVSGVARRAFRQPAVGEFPALVELWLTDPAGNPMGLLFPEQPGSSWVGQQVAFSGRVLRLVDYPDGVGVRRAPLIVGPSPPTMSGRPPAQPAWEPRFATEWALSAALLGLVVVVLGLQHARRPRRRTPGLRTRPQFRTPDEPRGDPDGG